MGWRTVGGRRRALGVVAAVAFAAGGCVVGSGYRPPFDLWAYLLTVGTAAPLAFCGRYPFAAVVASNLGYSVYLALGYQPSVNWWCALLALLVVCELRSWRAAAPATALSTAVLVQSGIAGGLAPGAVAAQAVLAPPAAALIGRALRRSAERQAELRRLTAQLAREQEDRARRAVVDERIRIAGELHDLIAHHMAVISVQAGLAGYVFGSDPAAARQAVDVIRGVSHEVLAELRNLTGALREGQDGPAGSPSGPPLDALPGLAGIAGLVERAVRAGGRVDYRQEGRTGPLSPGVELCAYRTVQEALANVAGHARGATTEVVVAQGPGRLRVTVRNAGDGERRAGAGEAAGHGLIGLRERARISGGELSAGETGDGGFEVSLVLPVRPDPSAGQGS
ncbi:sensor histidine kinase [Kitasatospora sp. NPDC051853]|uniref:sensor histidine kinase n=1 Tax=Kitasatospora sp. NPDC051853 TaxID=3364058 RepID=UPI00379D036F